VVLELEPLAGLAGEPSLIATNSGPLAPGSEVLRGQVGRLADRGGLGHRGVVLLAEV